MRRYILIVAGLVLCVAISLAQSPEVSCEILIAAQDLNHSLKGYPKQVKDVPAVWGTMESLPRYVILRITDCDASQVEHFLRQWCKTFSYEILAENDQGYRVRVTVDPQCISVSGDNRNLRAELKTYIQDTYGAIVVSYEAYEVVVDIPKPVVLAEVKADIHDKFDEVVDHRIFYFDGAAVDYAIAQGGLVELTKAQVLAMIRNKLDE